MTQHVQAVVFDLDDTLYPEREYVRSGYRAVGEYLRRQTGRTEAFEDWLWRRFESGRAGGAFDAMDEHFSLGLGSDDIVELVGVYRQHRPDIEPRPGAVELLRRLGKTRKLGLLSDGFLPAQRLKLEALGIEVLLDAAVLTEEMGRQFWKPAPEGYQAVRDMLGAADEACAYVGDNPGKDFVTPNRMGWLTVQLVCEGQVHSSNPAPEGGEPRIVVASLTEVEAAVGGRQ